MEERILTNLPSLFLALLLVTHVSAVDYNAFKAEDLLNIFDLMRNRGQSDLIEEIQKGSLHVSDKTNQYLVVAVMSKQELDSSKTWNSIPNNVNNRLNVYFNEKAKDCKKQIGGKPMHGEVLCLYYKNRLQDMIQTFKDDFGNGPLPIVVMFSVYIPCALIKGISYSCAEELGMNALVNYGTYKMIVGFDILFNNTDATAAKAFLCQGGIDVYEITNKNHIKMYATGMVSGDGKTPILFQNQFLKCLNTKAPIQKCTENCKTENLTEEFLKNYVDALCYNCTKECSNFIGLLTELNRQGFLDRAREFINDRTGDTCGKFADVTKYWIEFCVIQALQSSTVIGAKKETEIPERWEVPPSSSPWSLLYRFDPEVRFPQAHCNVNKVIKACRDSDRSDRFSNRNYENIIQKVRANTKPNTKKGRKPM